MTSTLVELATVADRKKTATLMTREALSRRELLAGSVTAGAMGVLCGETAAAVDGKKTFTILHTNDLHSNLIGLGPASDYTPFTLNDDKTRGGFARLATLLTSRKAARQNQGPVLVLDAGDYSMGTAFGAAILLMQASDNLLGIDPGKECDRVFGPADVELPALHLQ